MPKFNKKLPKDFLKYFSPEADKEYKAKHPVGYAVLVCVGIAVFLLPLTVYAIVNLYVFNADSGWLALGFAGSLVAGIGLFNIVAAWIGQYLGHAVTFGCFGLGGVMIAASELLMFSRGIRKLYLEELITYYVFTLALLILAIIPYIVFRIRIDEWLLSRYRIRKRDFRDLKKGKRNYFWYAAVNAEYPLSALYVANKAFTIIYAAAVALSLFCAWIRIVSVPLCVCMTAAYVLLAGMTVISGMRYNTEIHGKPFVLFVRINRKRFDSSLADLAEMLFLLAAGYSYVQVTAKLWSITLPLLKDLF